MVTVADPVTAPAKIPFLSLSPFLCFVDIFFTFTYIFTFTFTTPVYLPIKVHISRPTALITLHSSQVTLHPSTSILPDPSPFPFPFPFPSPLFPSLLPPVSLFDFPFTFTYIFTFTFTFTFTLAFTFTFTFTSPFYLPIIIHNSVGFIIFVNASPSTCCTRVGAPIHAARYRELIFRYAHMCVHMQMCARSMIAQNRAADPLVVVVSARRHWSRW